MQSNPALRASLLAAAMATSFGQSCAESVADFGGPIEVWHKPKGASEFQLIEVVPNIVPAAMRSYILRAAYAGNAQISSWFIMPFINAVDPNDAMTAANFDATWDEFVNYTEATRPAWVQEAEASQAIANSVTLAKITIGVGGGTINGIAMTSVSTKGNAGGTLAAATRFATSRAVAEGDELMFKYTMQANLPA